MLSELSKETSSEGRRELLRKVTEALDPANHASSERELAEFDYLLAAVAADYSIQVRGQIARLVAGTAAPFSQAAQRFAMDDQIEVARPVLENSHALTEGTLLKVIGQKSQDHLMAVTRRQTVSPVISHALVERGNDAVVTSLLKNERAEIAPTTYDVVVRRAETSPVLQAPLVRRSDVPIELLNGLYMQVEADLRKEIVGKIRNPCPPMNWKKPSSAAASASPAVYRQARGFRAAPTSASTVGRRAGSRARAPLSRCCAKAGSRTAFKIAFARLTDVDFDLIDRVVEDASIWTRWRLLCRAPVSTGAVCVPGGGTGSIPARALVPARKFGKLYESVPVQAAQRAIRFWKVRCRGLIAELAAFVVFAGPPDLLTRALPRRSSLWKVRAAT